MGEYYIVLFIIVAALRSLISIVLLNTGGVIVVNSASQFLLLDFLIGWFVHGHLCDFGRVFRVFRVEGEGWSRRVNSTRESPPARPGQGGLWCCG
jgi:hypothetical protein